MEISICLSIITLNVNGLNSTIKRHSVPEWIKNQDPSLCCLQEAHVRCKDTHSLKTERWKKIFHVNKKQKKAGAAILISDKIDFKTKTVTRDKNGCYIVKKESVQWEDTVFVSIYAPNIEAPKYIKQILTDLKEEIDSNTKRVAYFNAPLTSMDRSFRQKINKETLALNDTSDLMGLTDIHR